MNVLRRRSEDQTSSYLVRDFEIFYLKLLEYKSLLMSPPLTEAQQENISAARVSHTLKVMLDTMSVEGTQKGGGYAIGYFEEAKFIMAALADEFFLNLDWEGRLYWKDHLLESRLFHSHDAGDLFFKNLEQFLRDRDPIRRDLAEVYLLALGVGFQGKYRTLNDEGRLRAYAHQLYVFIYHQEPRLHGSQERLFPDAYGHTLDQGQKKYLQDVRQWILGFVTLFLILWLFSVEIWSKATAPLQDVMDHLLSLSTT